MFSGTLGRRTLTSCIAAAIVALAVPALAQTGRIQGKVVDDKDAAVQGAQILVTAIPDQGGQKWQATSDKNGNYIIGTLPKSGQYLVVASKDGVGEDEARVAVKIGNFTTTNFKLSRAARVSEEQAKKNAEIKKFFEAGVTAAQAGNHQAAVEAFTNAAVAMPTCADCYFNVGVSQQSLKNNEAAEAAFKKAIELGPDSVDAYNGLANVYNAQKKFKEAQAMSAEAVKRGGAAGGGNAESLYNQGVIAWNANDFPKAQELFAAAVKADEKHAEAHFMLGQAHLNLGKLPEAAREFETYTKLAPTGPNAEKAKANYEMLKQYIK